MLPEPREIRILRKQARLSQKELAEKSGLSQALISRIENETVNPTLKVLNKIYSVFGSKTPTEKATAEEIMHAPVVYCTIQHKLKEAVRLMETHGISQLPVIQHGICVGSVNENILLRNSKNPGFKVKDVMGAPFPAINYDIKLDKVAKLLYKTPAVMVLREKRTIGIITKSDLLRTMF